MMLRKKPEEIYNKEQQLCFIKEKAESKLSVATISTDQQKR